MSENIEKPEVSDLTRTVLETGLVDEHMAQMLEKWGTLPDGASQYVNNEALKEVTKDGLQKLAEKIGDEVEKHRILRETQFDLDRLRWPVVVALHRPTQYGREFIASGIQAVIDRMGRYYFRPDEIDEKWFVPGNYVERWANNPEQPPAMKQFLQQVVEAQFLYIGEQKVAMQVSVREEGLTNV